MDLCQPCSSVVGHDVACAATKDSWTLSFVAGFSSSSLQRGAAFAGSDLAIPRASCTFSCLRIVAILDWRLDIIVVTIWVLLLNRDASIAQEIAMLTQESIF
jgi:hypothetical protein